MAAPAPQDAAGPHLSLGFGGPQSPRFSEVDALGPAVYRSLEPGFGYQDSFAKYSARDCGERDVAGQLNEGTHAHYHANQECSEGFAGGARFSAIGLQCPFGADTISRFKHRSAPEGALPEIGRAH